MSLRSNSTMSEGSPSSKSDPDIQLGHRVRIQRGLCGQLIEPFPSWIDEYQGQMLHQA